jgi:hypothetical protein
LNNGIERLFVLSRVAPKPTGAFTMSKNFRKIFRFPKKEKAHSVAADYGGLGDPDPRTSSQPIVAGYFGDQHAPDPRSGGKSAPSLYSIDQSNIGPHAGGQPTPDPRSGSRQILEPPSKGQRIREGFIVSLDFVSAISEATDLLKPLKAACEVVKVVLKAAKVSIETSWCVEVVTHSMKMI